MIVLFFFLDSDNQKKMSELSKKKDELNTTVSTYKEFFKESSLLLEEFSSKTVALSVLPAEINRCCAHTEVISSLLRVLRYQKDT